MYCVRQTNTLSAHFCAVLGFSHMQKLCNNPKALRVIINTPAWDIDNIESMSYIHI